MFTRGGDDLKQTAVFIGGSDVAAAESLLKAATGCFFGPLRVSVMIDPNGANTTAAAAVLAATKHVDLAGSTVTVLAGTGPVGRRVVRLVAGHGAQIRVCSRRHDRAESVCQDIRAAIPAAKLTPTAVDAPAALTSAMSDAEVVFAAGGAGVQLLPEETRRACKQLRVAIDLNAVPPLGIGGIEVHDKAVDREGCICYGAIGVGQLKMKIHQARKKGLVW